MAEQLGTDIIRIHLVNGDARTVRFEEGADSSVTGNLIVNNRHVLSDAFNNVMSPSCCRAL